MYACEMWSLVHVVIFYLLPSVRVGWCPERDTSVAIKHDVFVHFVVEDDVSIVGLRR